MKHFIYLLTCLFSLSLFNCSASTEESLEITNSSSPLRTIERSCEFEVNLNSNRLFTLRAKGRSGKANRFKLSRIRAGRTAGHCFKTWKQSRSKRLSEISECSSLELVSDVELLYSEILADESLQHWPKEVSISTKGSKNHRKWCHKGFSEVIQRVFEIYQPCQASSDCQNPIAPICYNKECRRKPFPDQVHLRENFWSTSTSLDIHKNDKKGKRIGSIRRKILNFATTFEMKNRENSFLSVEGRTRLVSWGTHIDVIDSNDQLLGSIREKVWDSLLKIKTTYEILDPQGQILGTSVKIDLLATTITIRTPQGERIAEFKRDIRWVSGLDVWDITFYNQAAVDPRLLILIPGFKTYSDETK